MGKDKTPKEPNLSGFPVFYGHSGRTMSILFIE